MRNDELYSWLIQRLERPVDYPEGSFMHGKDNPFSFGGGFVNGGLSKEAMDLLRPIFCFDYMGAAEFEFGEVPRALGKIIERIDTFEAVTVSFKPSKIKFESYDERRFFKPTEDVPFYIFAAKHHVEYAKELIGNLLARNGKIRLKEGTCLPEATFKSKEKDGWQSRICGWLELDNGFFFFSDKAMFEKTVALFTAKEDAK